MAAVTSQDRWKMGYSFGTGDVAAQRLLLLAEVFAPSMAAVLGTLPDRDPPLVVDLGCGPGSSTAHLGRMLRAGRIVGLDASPSFVALARERVPGASFVAVDVTGDWPVPRTRARRSRGLRVRLLSERQVRVS